MTFSLGRCVNKRMRKLTDTLVFGTPVRESLDHRRDFHPSYQSGRIERHSAVLPRRTHSTLPI
jgi:hypothetical protein